MNVAVVGAGVIGYAVAYEVASRGAGVTVIDARGTGAGATGASAGVLAPYIEGHFAPLLKLTTCSQGGYDRFIERVRDDSGLDIEYHHSGTLQVAGNESDANALAAAAARLAAAGVAHEFVDGAGARRLEPQLDAGIAAALRVISHAHVNVHDLMSALEAAAARHGVTTVVDQVTRISTTDGAVRLEGAGTYHADVAVVAAGSWSGRVGVAASPEVPMKPIRGQRLHLRCHAPLITHVIWGTDCYLVPWRDGSVLVGATVEDVGFDEHATASGVRDLLSSASALVPMLAAAEFDSVRVGLRPLTPDELPIIGASSTTRGVYYATGHYRNGVLLAPLTATLIADMVLDGRECADFAFVGPRRFGL